MNRNGPQKKSILIVTGLAGAGMSSSLKHLEDMNYEVFDNFPLSLLDSLIEDTKPDEKPIAIGIDSRSRGFAPETLIAAAAKHKAFLLFLTADETVLQKRFTETRRRHPQAKDRPATAGIKREQELLHALKKEADLVLDTSTQSSHELKRALQGHFGSEENSKLTITLLSFGFKNGTPREADMLMDVRFLKNPYWEDALRPLTGQDEKVGQYVASDEGFNPFLERFKTLITTLLPRYNLEGKSYLTIAIGCTGGHHRSVYIVETLKPWLTEHGYITHIVHRDIDR